MNEQTKRKFDRLENWLLAVSVCVALVTAATSTIYRAQVEALRAEVQRLHDSPPQRCPATIQFAFRRVI